MSTEDGDGWRTTDVPPVDGQHGTRTEQGKPRGETRPEPDHLKDLHKFTWTEVQSDSLSQGPVPCPPTTVWVPVCRSPTVLQESRSCLGGEGWRYVGDEREEDSTPVGTSHPVVPSSLGQGGRSKEDRGSVPLRTPKRFETSKLSVGSGIVSPVYIFGKGKSPEVIEEVRGSPGVQGDLLMCLRRSSVRRWSGPQSTTGTWEDTSLGPGGGTGCV